MGATGAGVPTPSTDEARERVHEQRDAGRDQHAAARPAARAAVVRVPAGQRVRDRARHHAGGEREEQRAAGGGPRAVLAHAGTATRGVDRCGSRAAAGERRRASTIIAAPASAQPASTSSGCVSAEASKYATVRRAWPPAPGGRNWPATCQKPGSSSGSARVARARVPDRDEQQRGEPGAGGTQQTDQPGHRQRDGEHDQRGDRGQREVVARQRVHDRRDQRDDEQPAGHGEGGQRSEQPAAAEARADQQEGERDRHEDQREERGVDVDPRGSALAVGTTSRTVMPSPAFSASICATAGLAAEATSTVRSAGDHGAVRRRAARSPSRARSASA